MALSEYQALTFDCYGTLIDWESGMTAALRPLTDRLRPALSRDQVLEAHARHEAAAQRYTPAKLYREVLAVVYKRLAEEWSIPASWEECLVYGQSIRDWPAFPDTAASLQYLKRFYKLVVLSNVDNASFAFSARKLGVELDAFYSAEDIGSYKPATRNFEYMLERLAERGIPKPAILHTAESLFHDHVTAVRLGIDNCWIHRRHAEGGFGATADPGATPATRYRFNSLADLVAAHQREAR